MTYYGFASQNLLSSSTTQFQVTFTSAQSGVIFISSSPIDLGSATTFTFPSGASYYYFSSQTTWCVNVDLSKYYVGVIVYNASPPTDFSIQVDGQTLSVSSILGQGSCGADFILQMSDGLDISGITCCSFGNTAVDATTLELSKACSCSGFSTCNGCPAGGGSSSLACSSSSSSSTPPPPPPSSGTTNEAFYAQSPSSSSTTSSSVTGNEAFYVQSPQSSTTSSSGVENEAFYVQPVTVTPPSVSNEAFYIQPPKTTPSETGNEAFYIIKFQQTVTHVTIPEYSRFLSIVQAIYNVINFNVTSTASVKPVPTLPIQVQLSPSMNVSIQQGTTPVSQNYEEIVFEGFMSIPLIYFLGKYGIKLIKKARPKRNKK